MKIIYRISDAGYNKIKPDYIDNEKCLQNFCNASSLVQPIPPSPVEMW